MGYVTCMGPCFICGRVFSFNPHKVPSIKDSQGVKQPMCRECVTWANEERKKAGVEPWPEPHPDAYEPINEEEL